MFEYSNIRLFDIRLFDYSTTALATPIHALTLTE